ncbi:hypothetical protein AY599_15885 [Leptolyngbya valderiana BDU 20041]|nr:hypothetical protein AY599_15885 [Leptolyngbya valderiana BDU 20041]
MAADLASETLPNPSQIKIAPDSAGVLQDAVRVAQVTPLPLELGSVELTEDGRVAPSPGERMLRFSFVYKGLPFRGEVAKAGTGPLRLIGDFGKVPYTVERPDSRRRVRDLVLQGQADPKSRFRISRQQDIHLALEIGAPTPRTPVSIVAAVAAALLGAIPAIEAMAAALASRRAH